MPDHLNTPHVVKTESPLLRPGLTISATCSEKYVPEVAKRLLDIVRQINTHTDPTRKNDG